MSSPNGHSATLFERGADKLIALLAALDMRERSVEALDLLADLLGPRGQADASAAPAWPSDVCDDHTPFEFSVSMTRGGADLRILAEALDETPTLTAATAAGEQATARLATRLGLPLERLHEVQALFESTTPQGLFSRWHAVELHGDEPPHVKIYLNPLVHGRERAAATIEATLRRLGFSDTSLDAISAVTARGHEDELKYFSLDLSSGDAARVKVYVRHHGVSGVELESALRHTRRYSAGRAAAFCRTMSSGAERFAGRPVFSCLAWSADDPCPSATIYFPIASYVRDDAEANERTLRYLREIGIGTSTYDKAIAAFASRPLSAGVGMLSYVSTKIEQGTDRVTVYLSPEVYQVRAPGIRAA